MPDYNGMIMQGFQTGRELKRQEGERSALAALAGGDQNAIGDLATYNPQAAMQVQQQQQQRLDMQRKEQQVRLAEGKKVVGQAALQIAQMPVAQRPQAWDQAIDWLVGQGYDGLAQFKGKYSEQSLQGVIAEAGLANELRTATQPRYQVVPADADLVNTKDPVALQQFEVRRGQPEPSAPPKIIAQRPANMSDADLIAQAREAVRAGAQPNEVFAQLKAWGVQP